MIIVVFFHQNGISQEQISIYDSVALKNGRFERIVTYLGLGLVEDGRQKRNAIGIRRRCQRAAGVAGVRRLHSADCDGSGDGSSGSGMFLTARNHYVRWPRQTQNGDKTTTIVRVKCRGNNGGGGKKTAHSVILAVRRPLTRSEQWLTVVGKTDATKHDNTDGKMYEKKNTDDGSQNTILEIFYWEWMSNDNPAAGTSD